MDLVVSFSVDFVKMGPVSAPYAAVTETSSMKRHYEPERVVSSDVPPGFPEPNIPVLPVLYYRQPYGTGPAQNIKFCDDDLYWKMRARGVLSRPHRHPDCDCFMSYGASFPGSPVDELDFHLAITKILMATRGVVTQDVIREIKEDGQFIQMVAVKLIIEYPHLIDEVERNASLNGLFRDSASRRQFVERCVEFFVVYGLYRPRTHMQEYYTIAKARK